MKVYGIKEVHIYKEMADNGPYWLVELEGDLVVGGKRVCHYSAFMADWGQVVEFLNSGWQNV